MTAKWQEAALSTSVPGRFRFVKIPGPLSSMLRRKPSNASEKEKEKEQGQVQKKKVRFA